MNVSPIKLTDPIKTGQMLVYRDGFTYSEFDKKLDQMVKQHDQDRADRTFSSDLRSFFSPTPIVNQHTKEIIARPVWMVEATFSPAIKTSLNESFKTLSPVGQELNSSIAQNSLSLRPKSLTQLKLRRFWATPDFAKIVFLPMPIDFLSSDTRREVRNQCYALFGERQFGKMQEDDYGENVEVINNSILTFFMAEVENHDFLRLENTKKLSYALAHVTATDFQSYLAALQDFRTVEASYRELKNNFLRAKIQRNGINKRTKNRVMFIRDIPEIRKVFIKEKIKCV